LRFSASGYSFIHRLRTDLRGKLMSLAEKYLPYYTYEDYKQWEGDWELINGIPYAMAPSPLKKHQLVAVKIVNQIFEQLKGCPEDCQVIFEVDWIISRDTVVRPDILVVCGDESEDFVRKTPEVVFEIVSESSSRKDENLKFELYEKEGVEYYALVYPEEKRVKVYKLINGRFINVFDRNKGAFSFSVKCTFTLNLDELWERF